MYTRPIERGQEPLGRAPTQPDPHALCTAAHLNRNELDDLYCTAIVGCWTECCAATFTRSLRNEGASHGPETRRRPVCVWFSTCSCKKRGL